MDERKQPAPDENLDEKMERDTEIRRETAIHNALGPTEEEQSEQERRRKPEDE